MLVWHPQAHVAEQLTAGGIIVGSLVAFVYWLRMTWKLIRGASPERRNP